MPGAKLTKTNELQSRRKLQNQERKLENKESLKQEYAKIVEDQLKDEIIEKVPETATGNRIYCMPHKPFVRDSAMTTKVRMVFDASARPDSSSNSIDDCMCKGLAIQPHLWDILIRARMSPYILIGDVQKAFLQIEIECIQVFVHLGGGVKRNTYVFLGCPLALKPVLSCSEIH